MSYQVSYIRLIVGDNLPPYKYTDAEIQAAISITTFAPPFPHDLVMSALLGFEKFPLGE